jgi:hypothetical protein
MRGFQIFLLTILIAASFCKPDGGDHEKFKEKHKKHKECMKETKQLTECCELPKPKDTADECNEKMTELENKEGHEKMKAFSCYIECEFKSKGFLVEKEIQWDKIKEYHEEHKSEVAEFEDASTKALEFCEPKGK